MMANSLGCCGSDELPSRIFFVADGLRHGTIIQYSLKFLVFLIKKWGAPFGGGREGGGRGGSSLARSGNVLPPLPPPVGGRGDCCLQCYGSDKCSPLGGRRERAMRAWGQIMCACRRNRSPLRPLRERGAFAAYNVTARTNVAPLGAEGSELCERGDK